MVKRFSKTSISYRNSSRRPKNHLDSRNAPVSQIIRSPGKYDGLTSLQTLCDALPEDVQRPTEISHTEHLEINEAADSHRSTPEFDDKTLASVPVQEDDTTSDTSHEKGKQ